MKLFVVLLSVVAGVTWAAPTTEIDWDSVRPIYEFQSWQEEHPAHMAMVEEMGLMADSASVRFVPNGRIVGGFEATRHQFPYQVGLVLHLTSGNSFCGGSLVSKNYVMTAAHCLDG